METNAQLILVMQTLETVFTLQLTVMTIMHVPLTLAIFQAEFAFMSGKFVSTRRYVPLTVAVLAAESASLPTSLFN
jgi:hypothetical protein